MDCERRQTDDRRRARLAEDLDEQALATLNSGGKVLLLIQPGRVKFSLFFMPTAQATSNIPAMMSTNQAISG